MRNRIWLPLGLALIMAITVAGSPVKALACGPMIAAGAAAAPAIGSGIVGIITTVGSALGLVKEAKDIVAPTPAGPPYPNQIVPSSAAAPPPGYAGPFTLGPNQSGVVNPGPSSYGYSQPNGAWSEPRTPY